MNRSGPRLPPEVGKKLDQTGLSNTILNQVNESIKGLRLNPELVMEAFWAMNPPMV
jgi:hypothetical protein